MASELKSRRASPALLIIGGIAIGLAAILAVYAVLIGTGIVSGRRNVLVFSARSLEKQYDGLPLEADGWIITGGKLKPGHTAEAEVVGSQTMPGEGRARITSFRILDELGNDVTTTYEYELRDGALTVLPREIVLWSGSGEKDYDGTALWNNHWGYESGSLLDGHRIRVTLPSRLTEVGTAPNEIAAVVEDASGRDVTYLYRIVTHPGDLTVYGQRLIITSASAEKLYDGTPLSDPAYAVTGGSLMPGHRLSVSMDASLTDAGSVENLFTYTITDAYGNDVVGDYEIECVFGTLTVRRAELVVASGDARKPYDGKPLTSDAYTITSGVLADGQTILMQARGSQTEIGYSTNAFTIRVRDAGGRDVTVNYDLILRPGRLVVYDTEHPYEQVSYDPGDDPGGDDTFDPGDFTFDPGDLTIDPGDLTVDPGDVTIDPSEWNKPVDPTKGEIAHSGNTLPEDMKNVPVVSIRSTADGYVYLRYTSYGSYTGTGWTPGTSAMTGMSVFMNPCYIASTLMPERKNVSARRELELKWDHPLDNLLVPYYAMAGVDQAVNDVAVPSGDLTSYTVTHLPFEGALPDGQAERQSYIVAYMISYLGADARNRYLTVPADTAKVLEGIAADVGLNRYSSTIIEDVAGYISKAIVYNKNMAPIPGTEDMVAYVLTEGGEGICQHFASAAVLMYRVLGVPARYVTGFRVYAEEGQWVDVTAARAHAWVEVWTDDYGWIPVEVTAGRRPGEDTDADRLSLGLTADSGTFLYDGQAHTVGTCTITAGSLRDGDTITRVEMSGTLTEPGQVSNRILSVVISDAYGRDVTALYDISLRPGVIRVERIPLTVSSASAAKYYDGTPLSDPSCTYDEDALRPGHFLLAEAVGSITEVGTVPNTLVVLVFDENGEDASAYYDLTVIEGRLTVREVPYGELTIRTGSASRVYDGTPLTSDEWELVSGALREGDVLLVDMGSAQTDAGVCVNKPTLRIISPDGEDVTDRYVLDRSAYGTLTVTPAPLVITSDSAEKVYDGKPLTAPGFTVDVADGGRLPHGYRVRVTVGGSQTEVGIGVNRMTDVRILDELGEDVSANYTIRLVFGSLVVTPAGWTDE